MFQVSGHSLFNCEQFKALDVNKRWDEVKKHRLCSICFGKHMTNECKNKFTCKKCQGRHSTLLHNETKNKEKGAISANSARIGANDVLLATALIKCRAKNGEYITLRALIDQGAQATFITEAAAQRLQLHREKILAQIDGFGDTPVGTAKSMISIMISAMHDEFFTTINAIVMTKVTKNIPANRMDASEWPHLNGIELADPNFNIPAPVDLSIGWDCFGEFILAGVIKGEMNMPFAQLTKFGWIVMGKTNHTTKKVRSCVVIMQLEEQLKRFWEIESIPGEEKSLDDDKCEVFYESNTTRSEDGRYTVALPFKQAQPSLGRSRNIAIAQLIQMEKKFAKDSEFKEKYAKCIQEYLDLGHMVPAESTEDESVFTSNGHQYYKSAYLPHHAVIKESSSTTKLRVVFDASRKTTSGISLNQSMLTGPTIQKDIISILIRWRKYQVVFTADVEKMYRQIRVRDSDADYQRIVWRTDPSQPIKDYKLTTVTFRTSGAPYLAIRTLQQLARDEMKQFPNAATIALRDFYVDDLLSGCDTINEAIQLQSEIKCLMKKGGLDIRK